MRWNAAAGGTSRLRRLEFTAGWNAAAQIEQDLAERGSDRHFDQTGPDDSSGQGKHLRARTRARSNRGKPIAAMLHDGGDVREGFNVIDEGRLSPQTPFRRIRRPGYGLPAFAFDRSQESRLFTTDVGAGSDSKIDLKMEIAIEHASAQQSFAPGLSNGCFDPCDRQG